MKRYVYGYDFGTRSCRLVMMSLETGETASEAMDYPHGVISGSSFGGVPLPKDWYLQHPQDWIDVMCALSRSMLKKSAVLPEQVVAVGTDFTNCTLLPVSKDGSPLCLNPAYELRPNAWPKLWKHHAAQPYAEEIESYAKSNTDWLKSHFGNNVSSEWVFPKVLQVFREDPDIYEAADLFIEAVDWIVYALSGELTRCTATLGVNAFWIKGRGFPDKSFFAAFGERFENVVEEKMRGREVTVGEAVGHLTPRMAVAMGLTERTIVSSGHGDSEVSCCGAGVVESGSMIMAMGTSTCHQMLYGSYHGFDGVCAIAGDGMVPGLYSYESGQPAVGDIFEWYAEKCVPAPYREEADNRGIAVLDLLNEKASVLEAGRSGLIALDWFNGNRSTLANYNLTGLILGLTLETKPEEIYRCLVEATQFGSRKIIENYEKNGLRVEHLFATGGLAEKSAFVMQICADILGREVIVPLFDDVPARGAAICAAVAAGPDNGGAAGFAEAVAKLTPRDRALYAPNPANREIYDELYTFYEKLYELFGADGSFMSRLKSVGNGKTPEIFGKNVKESAL